MSEEDFEIIKDIIYTENGEQMNYIDIGLFQDECPRFINAIEKLLKCYNDQQKEIEELKIDNDIMKQDLNNNIVYKDEIEESYISKQKIKDKIERLKVLAETSDDENFNCCEMDIRKNQIYLLQNLLQESE